MSGRESAGEGLSLLPERAGGPAFDAPWQARAFALTVLLHGRGAFDWQEWSAALARECATQGPGASGYYDAWVRALDAVLAAKGIVAGAADRAAITDGDDGS